MRSSWIGILLERGEDALLAELCTAEDEMQRDEGLSRT